MDDYTGPKIEDITKIDLVVIAFRDHITNRVEPRLAFKYGDIWYFLSDRNEDLKRIRIRPDIAREIDRIREKNASESES